MSRNLDIAALRSLIAIADMGGVTRAAAQVNLTQSAVSLQIRRLEESFGRTLIERRGRGVALTPQAERLVVYARRLLALNDEIAERMTATNERGWLRLGAPCDLLNLHVPAVMRAFRARHPETRVTFESEVSAILRQKCAGGELDLILTTELEPGPGGEELARLPLVWIGAPGGAAWRRRPLPVATVAACAFNRPTLGALTEAQIDWAPEGSALSKVAADGAVAGDIAVHTMLAGTIPASFETIAHGGALPDLPTFGVNLYLTSGPRRPFAEPLAAMLREAFGAAEAIAAE